MPSSMSFKSLLPDFLTDGADGDIVFTGHRIGLHHLIERYNAGFSPEMLVCQYPSLSLSLVHRTIAYYLDQQAAVDSYLATYREEMRNQEATVNHINLAELRERLQKMSEPVATAN